MKKRLSLFLVAVCSSLALFGFTHVKADTPIYRLYNRTNGGAPLYDI